MSTYGLDLRDSLWGENPFGVRRLNALVSGLPRDSALSRSVNSEIWTQEEELLATIVDQLAVSNYMYVKANSKQGAVLPELTRFPRPWEDKDKGGGRRAQSSPDEARAFFANPEFGSTLWDAHGAEEPS